MVKRKAKDLEDGIPAEEPRRSSRRVSTAKEEIAPEKSKPAPTPKTAKKVQKPAKDVSATVDGEVALNSDTKPTKATKERLAAPTKTSTSDAPTGRQYWLMKAEPESRLEKGHDVKFSIDDLASKTEPEPWDGIRAYPARNNLRAMKKGDLAFFYHSSCKVPAIVGVMEIVQEHTPDLSAHDPEAPYHDPSSKPEDPKWSVVHVEFRQKLETPITLKDLRAFQAEKGNPLENMQMLKLTRLSVSKVSAEEWEFLTGVMEKNGDVIKA